MKTSARASVQLASLFLATTGALTTLTASAAFAAPAPAPAAAAAAEVQIMAGAPCIVTGYSLHAMEEMAKDNITTGQVEDIVYSTCSKAVKQSNGTFKYTTKKIVVIGNANGYIVTAWRR